MFQITIAVLGTNNHPNLINLVMQIIPQLWYLLIFFSSQNNNSSIIHVVVIFVGYKEQFEGSPLSVQYDARAKLKESKVKMSRNQINPEPGVTYLIPRPLCSAFHLL